MLKNSPGNDQIYKKILSNKPFMAARIGATEIKAILYPKLPKILQSVFKKRIFGRMFTLAGFFPSNEENIIKFSEMMINDIQQVDILGSWRPEEIFLKKYLKNASQCKLNNLEPYLHEFPWSKALKDKKVLVIHPFAESIYEQYKKKEFLFPNKNVLPNFNLDIIKAVQSLSGEKNPFKNWFEALQFMKDEISKKDFDIALVGCGAYGFSLASYVKKIGKQSVHMGGSLQILFGIKGARWENHPVISKFFNENWIRPKLEDKPSKSHLVENGCYW
tara:strand:- start:23 stop:847 length:825 start_codon:yes stop_codon:yes gene_type:complete